MLNDELLQVSAGKKVFLEQIECITGGHNDKARVFELRFRTAVF